MQALRFFEAWKEWPCFSMPPAEYFYISCQSLGFLHLHIKGERLLLFCWCGWTSAIQYSARRDEMQVLLNTLEQAHSDGHPGLDAIT